MCDLVAQATVTAQKNHTEAKVCMQALSKLPKVAQVVQKLCSTAKSTDHRKMSKLHQKIHGARSQFSVWISQQAWQ